MYTEHLTAAPAVAMIDRTHGVSMAAPGTLPRRRSRAAVASDATQGASLVSHELPFAARASVTVSRTLLYPVAGAVLGAMLLGVPGAILGGIAGVVLAR